MTKLKSIVKLPLKDCAMNNKPYQTIIFECSSMSDLIKDIPEFLLNLKESGNFFLIADNEITENIISNSIFDYIDIATKKSFFCKNIVIFPSKSNELNLRRGIRYLLWFVKDLDKNYFDKDKIREKHIWKDVEWGKRAKNYNPLGKDPGNVWIPTKDDGRGRITQHILLSIEQIINRCISSTVLNSQGVFIKHFSKINASVINSSNFTLKSYQISKRGCLKDILGCHSNKRINVKANVVFSSSEKMAEIKDETVDVMVTSPPYWDLKNYFKAGQIGQELYEDYLNRLNKVWSETYRCLKKTGHMWININVRTKNRKLINIPVDIIISCEELGFSLKNIIIWHKSSGIPTNKNNLTDRHEYFLWFVKSKNHVIYSDVLNSFSEYANQDINHGFIWNINRKAGSVGKDYIHPAIYPTELINRVINLCSDKGDLILDPFLGSGTSMFSALKNHRNFIGYEYNEDFDKLIKHRAESESIDLKLVKFQYQNTPSKSDTPVSLIR